MKVFLSSVRSGFEPFRDAAYCAAEDVAERAIRFEDMPARADPSRKACLEGVEEADVIVLLLGSRYGAPQTSSGISPTHEEYRHAVGRGKRVIAFIQQDVILEPEQETLKREVGGSDWAFGTMYTSFSTPEELARKVTRALSAELRRSRTPSVDLKAAQDRCDAFAVSHAEPRECAISVAIHPVTDLQLLRPAQLRSPQLVDDLIEVGQRRDAGILSRRRETTDRIQDDMVVISQDGASIQVTRGGAIRVVQDAGARHAEQNYGLPGDVLVEDVHDRTVQGIRCAIAVLDLVDQAGQVRDLVVTCAFLEPGYITWRTRRERDANPNQGSMLAPGQVVYQIEPRPVQRTRLVELADQIAEDFVATIDGRVRR